ncbi:MAG: hypothetical protein ACLP41_11495, partial [Acidimicrobiales bacterium]
GGLVTPELVVASDTSPRGHRHSRRRQGGRCEPPLTLRFSLGLRPSLDLGLVRGEGLRRERH